MFRKRNLKSRRKSLKSSLSISNPLLKIMGLNLFLAPSETLFTSKSRYVLLKY